MKKRAIRAYTETSVFGGVDDPEFDKTSKLFFDLARKERFKIVVSALVKDEISAAPESIKSFFNGVLSYSELLEISPDAYALQNAYLKAKILTEKSRTDALHVALASVSDCTIIVSWNFKHIVNFRKIAMYNAVNMIEGYKPIAIHSPLEVIGDEKEII